MTFQFPHTTYETPCMLNKTKEFNFPGREIPHCLVNLVVASFMLEGTTLLALDEVNFGKDCGY